MLLALYRNLDLEGTKIWISESLWIFLCIFLPSILFTILTGMKEAFVCCLGRERGGMVTLLSLYRNFWIWREWKAGNLSHCGYSKAFPSLFFVYSLVRGWKRLMFAVLGEIEEEIYYSLYTNFWIWREWKTGNLNHCGRSYVFPSLHYLRSCEGMEEAEQINESLYVYICCV